ncbi:sensor histidine kinase [Paremcibacter congregatus]|uniref:histidine kinase n=1 Tax=Paremcibacter congregatus TaxID=2043170 RepID=A0A2G4YVZ1_9PROT|nr:sensor histidine kinase [Paremcibacter congregatus]PHZ86511.1 hypothetical protein CRD36_01095 [Paremcibacter congregatus]QDE26314.1 sensor histidine kinase [Paremcibacter congregatus]
MNSLKSRLTIGVLVVSLIFFTSLIVANVIFFNRFGEDFVTTRLQHDTDALLVALKVDAQGNLQLDEHNLNPIFLQPFSGHYFRIELQHGAFQSRSLWEETMPVERIPVGQTKTTRRPGPSGQDLLVLEGGYFKAGHQVWISVAENYTPITNSLHSLTLTLILINGAVIVLLMLLQRFLVDRGLVPLTKSTAELSRLGKGEQNFLNEEVPTEVLPLVQEINKLLVMVDNRVKRSTTALGNLAHALKTPLALIEQSVSGCDKNNAGQICGDIREAVGQIKHQLNSELRRARIIGLSAHGQKIDISDFISPLITTLETIYQDKHIVFHVDIAPGAAYVGDRHDLMELFGNLLDNACKWAKGHIYITITSDPEMEIIIQDDGPGITSDMMAQVETRGTRLDEAGEGHGLGLSIVREIIDQNNAEIYYSHSEKYGGLKVIIKV